MKHIRQTTLRIIVGLLLVAPLSAGAQMYGSYGSNASASSAGASASSYWGGGGYSYPYQAYSQGYSHQSNYQLYWCETYYSYSPCPVQYHYPTYYYYPQTYYYPTYYYDPYAYGGGYGWNFNFSYGW